MLVASIFSAIGFPIMGFIISKVYFSLMAMTYDLTKVSDLDQWLWYYLIFVLTFGLLKGSE
jgi:hypothetical protein